MCCYLKLVKVTCFKRDEIGKNIAVSNKDAVLVKYMMPGNQAAPVYKKFIKANQVVRAFFNLGGIKRFHIFQLSSEPEYIFKPACRILYISVLYPESESKCGFGK